MGIIGHIEGRKIEQNDHGRYQRQVKTKPKTLSLSAAEEFT